MKHLDYVLNLARFAFRENPLLYASVAVSLFSVAIELLAMSSLLPLFELISGGAPSTNGFISRALISSGLPLSAGALLWVFILLLTARILTQLIGQSLSMYLGKRVMAQLCSQAFAQIIYRLEIKEINEKSIGFYISLAGDESFRASTLVISLTQFMGTAVLAVLYFAAIALFSPATAGLVVVFLLCSLIFLSKVIKVSHRLGGRQIEESRTATSVFLDSLNNVKAVRAFSAEKYVADIHRSLMFRYTKTLFWVDEIALLTRLVPVLLLLLFFGCWLAWSTQPIESIGIAFIVTMIVYLMRFFPAVGQAVNLSMKIASDARSGKDVTAIVGRDLPKQNPTARSLGGIDRIDLLDVSFAYDEHAGKEILKGINIRFERGKSYALAGKSGVGKSTLGDILLKFYAPTSGGLYLNDVPVSDTSDSEIRKRIILVSQEAAIFDDTVKNNVCLGIRASLSEVQAACTRACIHEDIQGMANGYDTRLQYQGKNLSGGQRQRLGIARALLRNPDMLILDESTNALDKTTQDRVVESILREYADKIVIFVTHDPHIMKRVSEVVDLEKINLGTVPLSAPYRQPADAK